MSGPQAPNPEQAPADRSAEAAPSTVEPLALTHAADQPAALRDAAAIAARVAADEAAADAERTRLRTHRLPILEVTAHRPPPLRADEVLHAIRPTALLERAPAPLPSGGTLYLTSRRLIHVGAEETTEIELESIVDIAVALERLLLMGLADGSDMAIEVDQPRLLRVQLAAARAAAREHRP